MKKIILFTLPILFCLKSFCQADISNSISAKPVADYSQLMKKSKNQKIAAWIMLGGGFVMTATSLFIAAPKATEDYVGIYGSLLSDEPSTPHDYTVEAILLAGGAAAMLSSIPLFIASGKNKRKAKAMSTSIKMEKASVIQGYNMTKINYPVLSLKINL